MNRLTTEDLLKLELLEDRILVIEEEPAETNTGLILTGDPIWERRASVIKTGPGLLPVGMPLKTGDRVYIGKNAGVVIEFDLDEPDGTYKLTKMLLVRLSGVLLVEENPDEEDDLPF